MASALARRSVSQQIMVDFELTGRSIARIADLAVSVEDWRWLARSVARQLGRPVRTRQSSTIVRADLNDQLRSEPPTGPERRLPHPPEVTER